MYDISTQPERREPVPMGRGRRYDSPLLEAHRFPRPQVYLPLHPGSSDDDDDMLLIVLHCYLGCQVSIQFETRQQSLIGVSQLSQSTRELLRAAGVLQTISEDDTTTDFQ